MQLSLKRGELSAGCIARQRNLALPCPAVVAPQATSCRSCQLECSASLRSFVLERPSSKCMQRRPCRRQAVICRAAAKSFYEVLGVPQSASDRDIKSAYRKLAMKLHPDVNKAPDAQKRFMEVKVAYETLSDTKQRAEYDRRLRMGGYSSAGGRSSGSYGGSTSYGSGGGSWESYGSYGKGPNFTQEPVPGLDDLIRELEKEFTAWANTRGQSARAKSLMEELEDLGGEFLDFLEETLGIKDAPSPSGSSSQQQQQQQRGSGTASGDSRSAAERFDAFWQQYGGETADKNSSKTPGAGSSSSGSLSSAGPGSGSSASSGARKSSSSTSGPTTTRSADDDIEAQLLALKKKLNKN